MTQMKQNLIYILYKTKINYRVNNISDRICVVVKRHLECEVKTQHTFVSGGKQSLFYIVIFLQKVMYAQFYEGQIELS